MRQSLLKLILIWIATALTPARSAAAAPPDSTLAVRRLATTARLAAEEYGLGVRNGQVVQPAEVEEAKLFLEESRKAAAGLPATHAGLVERQLTDLIASLDRTESPDSVAERVERLVSALAGDLGVALDELPAIAPSLSRGEAIYRAQCASCHGVAGKGDGPAARGLTPVPARLGDSVLFRQATPLDFYRRITIGVAGTSMAPYEGSLSLDDRWAVALYSSTLRLPAARGTVPPSLGDFHVTAALSDQALLDSLGTRDLGRVAAARAAAGGERRRDYGPVFALVRARLDSSFGFAKSGDVAAARSAAINAYMAFELVERELRVKDPALVARAEKAFADARQKEDPAGQARTREELARALERAERTIGTALTPVSLFVQSFLILIREGLEAILVIGALIAFLAKVGANDRKRDIHLGVAAAIGLSVVTAVLIETIFRLSPTHQEAFEGGTMVVATVMLFSVSYWLVSKMEVAKWNEFVKSRLSEALTKRSILALASVAFLAVYREGFETVLFYKALALSGGTVETAAPIVAGFVTAAIGLLIIFVLINRYGVRLPLKPFFGVTSGFLYLMAFVFAGTAVAELQEGGFIPTTSIPRMVRAPTFGIYPTVQSVSAQAALLLLAAVALVWTFVVAPRRAAAVARTAAPRGSRRRRRRTVNR